MTLVGDKPCSFPCQYYRGSRGSSRQTLESLESCQQLLLVLIRQGVDILALVLEAVGAPDQRSLELGRPSGRNFGGQTAGPDPGLDAGEILPLVDAVANIGVGCSRGIDLGLLGADPVRHKAGAQAPGVVLLCQCARRHGWQ